ncbi:MAG: transcription-repair coupling factor [Candidatus Edwardsbacteria bacterium]
MFVILPNQESAEKRSDDLITLLGREYISYLPALDDLTTPDIEIVGTRIEALSNFQKCMTRILVTSLPSLLQKTLSPSELNNLTLEIKVGQQLEMERVFQRLLALGFDRAQIVENPGEFAVRGGIVDIFTFGNENPVRLEFLGDEIVSLREFEVLTQRSIGHKERVNLLPRYEKPTTIILEYLVSKDTLIFFEEESECKTEAERLREEMKNIYEQTELSAETILVDYEEMLKGLFSYQTLFLGNTNIKKGSETEITLITQPVEPFFSNLERLKERLKKLSEDGYTTFIFCDTTGQKERMEEILMPEELYPHSLPPPVGEGKKEGWSEEDMRPKIACVVGSLHAGFIMPEAHLALITEREIFQREKKRKFRRFKGGGAIRNLQLLKLDDYLVHLDYGIGKYLGLKTIVIDEKETECLALLYAEEEKLYVPIEQMHRVEKYIADEGKIPPLSRLSTTHWEETKKRAKKAIKDMAQALISLYAYRTSQSGFAFSQDTLWQRELEASFIYEETPDQLKTTQEIKEDLEKPKPMDRLLCGDVGYGKTEVAIRAAFKVIMDSKQVAVLVPTTILAEQHYQTFRERLAEYPINLRMLSRFKSEKEQRRIIKELEEGRVDLVIGTHRLLSKDVEFKDLGLLIIDEEQRFGVAHKETLKQLRKSVDCLTMTATPIPRTLHMSLVGARDMSMIETPPKDRLSIVTRILEWNEEHIIESILREVERQGQVYFVHNRVESIEAMASYLRRLLPHLRIAVAHGQMEERELERVMLNFMNHQYDVLVTTTIIESGLDIPNVNTIIINRADKFGLAQLYQLRGRVGRSNRRAYAYFLIPKSGRITQEARKRLRALEEFTELGSGFQLALRDLEIRGAGNLLGREQHGHIIAVGFDLYCQLLQEAVRELKGEPEVGAFHEMPSLSFDFQANIPENYVGDSAERVMLYRRLSRVKNLEELKKLKEEMEDRFGKIPLAVEYLLEIVELKIFAIEKGIEKIVLKNSLLEFQFRNGESPSRGNIERMVKDITYPLEFTGGKPFVLKISLGRLDVSRKLEIARKVLQDL